MPAAEIPVPTEMDVVSADSAGLAIKRVRPAKTDQKEKIVRRGGEADKARGSDEVCYITDLMAKLLVNTAKNVSSLQAATFDMVVFQKADPLGMQVTGRTKAAAKAYSEQVARLPPSAKGAHFSPHVLIWLELAGAVAAFLNAHAKKDSPS
eukprot:TRINITY_DN102182_c0_g1_i1.p2 TRINITY_DN102182_c0_g1~~TRINITY_DN102182_c0_g1_i1.p2  ORF type:complete len:151 (-),score=37.01 TRINITY_DN102182_c0_g1_i1:568-1020(-)